MSIATDSSVTVERVMFPAGESEKSETTEDALTSRLRTRRIAAELVLPGAHIDAETVAHGIAGLLDVPIIDVLVEWLCTVRELEAAARSTREEPGRTDHVTLRSQQVTWTWKPSLDVLVDERWCAGVELEVGLALDITLVEGEVRGGNLVALDGGPCGVTVSLSVQGQELASGSLRSLVPRVTIPLGDGIPLVRRHHPERRSATQPSGPTWVVARGRPTVVAPASA